MKYRSLRSYLPLWHCGDRSNKYSLKQTGCVHCCCYKLNKTCTNGQIIKFHHKNISNSRQEHSVIVRLFSYPSQIYINSWFNKREYTERVWYYVVKWLMYRTGTVSCTKLRLLKVKLTYIA